MWNGRYTFQSDAKVTDLDLDVLVAGPAWGWRNFRRVRLATPHSCLWCGWQSGCRFPARVAAHQGQRIAA